MRSSLLVSVVLLAVLACTANRSADQTGTLYGETITLADTTRISEILSHPDNYVGERVLVAGMVVDVCSKRGCWLELASDREFETLRVKVEDGVIIFPMTARGHRAVVEGTVERLELTEEQARERAQHHAEEQGLAFDPSTITGPETTYQLRGIGAAIFE
jgi:hypothetical protein